MTLVLVNGNGLTTEERNKEPYSSDFTGPSSISNYPEKDTDDHLCKRESIGFRD